jgi:hypothetical protein
MYSDFEAASGGVSCAMAMGATNGHKTIALPTIPNCEYLPSMIFKNRLFGCDLRLTTSYWLSFATNLVWLG